MQAQDYQRALAWARRVVKEYPQLVQPCESTYNAALCLLHVEEERKLFYRTIREITFSDMGSLTPEQAAYAAKDIILGTIAALNKTKDVNNG